MSLGKLYLSISVSAYMTGLDCTEGVIDVVVDVKLCLTNVILLGNIELAC